MVRHSDQGQILIELVWALVFLLTFVTLALLLNQEAYKGSKHYGYPTHKEKY